MLLQMIYPGYQLNPGDMFQVEPDRVMFATGGPKTASERAASRRFRKAAAKAKAPEIIEEDNSESADASTPTAEASTISEADEGSIRRTHKVNLTELLDTAKTILSNKKDTPRAKQKQALRELTGTIRKAIGNVNKASINSLDDDLNALLSQLKIASKTSSNVVSEKNEEEPSTSSTASKGLISKEDRLALREAMREARNNPVDPSKPYATPWYPRPYMSAFAFIPRYLEVNQNICSAVYLRHPVARPGLAEVPTPFGSETSQLAFTWYLRRR
jgi:ribosomal protein S4